MVERLDSLAEVYVQPGESHLVTEPSVLRTVLGSCVGVTFWAPHLSLAALCHPMLPAAPRRSAKLSLSAGRRYVDFAICDLARRFDAFGVRRRDVQVKLFGGADVLLVSGGISRPTVGKLNCEAALKVLGGEGFVVASSSLGGNSGLHIQFFTQTGEVFLKRLV